MALSGVIASFATGTYTITREAGDTYDAQGRKVAGTTSTLTMVAGVIPVTGRDLSALPQGQRTDETRVIYTTTPLLTRNPGGKPDIITIDGEPWAITKVERWQGFGETNYRAYAHRRTVP